MNLYTPHPHHHAGFATTPATAHTTTTNGHQHAPSLQLLEQQSRALQAAILAFDQPPAPSLREVLGAYRIKGDGDREMLLTILNAKAAEDQRVASMATLHQTILQVLHANLVSASSVSSSETNQLPPITSNSPSMDAQSHLSTSSSVSSPAASHKSINAQQTRSRYSRSPPLANPSGRHASRTPLMSISALTSPTLPSKSTIPSRRRTDMEVDGEEERQELSRRREGGSSMNESRMMTSNVRAERGAHSRSDSGSPSMQSRTSHASTSGSGEGRSSLERLSSERSTC
ncbi:hypothetical protein CPB86DRAFT_780019 [Serendipita vermifera]|nr:hypothetical protein CPB86DRAFT_780019 [Serendipita vermifera]